MRNSLMRFDGVFLSHDPKTLKISVQNDVNTQRLLTGLSLTLDTLEGVRAISGTGELFGERCTEDFKKLKDAYTKRRAAVLAVPYMGASRAVLSKLEFTGGSKAGFMGVEFRFELVHGASHAAIKRAPVHIAEEGEDMWDIAYREGVSIEELVRLNPHIRYINELDEGERVKLY